MRRIIFLLVLVLLLAGVYTLNQAAANWHYVIPVQPGEVAYLATFDGFTEDWQQYQGALEAQILPAGVLHLETTEDNSGPFSVTKQHFGDFDVRVQTTPVAGPLDNGYGVIFRLQDKDNGDLSDDSYYWFLISSDGYYQVVRVLNGQPKRLSDWIPSPSIQQGLNVTNYLRVVASGDQFRFYINGEPVQLCVPNDAAGESTYQEYGAGCVEGQMVETLTDASLASGRLGMIAHAFTLPSGEPSLAVEFDNLVILGPDAVSG